MEAHFHTRIIDNAIAKEPTESLADALIEVKKAFEEIEQIYDIKQALRGDRNENTAK